MCWLHLYVPKPLNHGVPWSLCSIFLYFLIYVPTLSLFHWRPGCTEKALPASLTHPTPSAPLMTSVSFRLSTCRPDDSHLGISASSVEAFHRQIKQLPDGTQVICCPYRVTLTKILLSASFQTCTSPTSVFKKQLQTMTLNRCVTQNRHRSLSFWATLSERWSNFIPTGTEVDHPAASTIPHCEARQRERPKTVRRDW